MVRVEIAAASTFLSGEVFTFLSGVSRVFGNEGKADKPNTKCHGDLFGQSFASSGCRRCLLQDEDHSGSRPHSFPGLY